MTYLQQGDVIVQRIDAVPPGAKKTDDAVIAYGESTGHKHQLAGRAVKMLLDTAIFVRVLKEAKMLHEEHKALILPPGDYKMDFVREYDHFEEEARRVQD